jgi:uncharacterized protein YndB with AHSA1/START domain
MVMRGPNGEEMPHEGVLLEVSPGKRFVFTDTLTTGWRPQTPFMGSSLFRMDRNDLRLAA